MNRFYKFLIALFAFGIALQGSAKAPKYVFYFIGDGMGFGQIQSTEMYYRFGAPVPGADSLIFTRFPVAGYITTYSASSTVTDSAAAGTALSTGEKTTNGQLGTDPDMNPLTSVAKQLKEKGMGVAIFTTVAADDATPGAFYATQPTRNNHYLIARQAAESHYDFIAGAGLRDPYNRKEGGKDNVYRYFEENGYTFVRGIEEFEKHRQADRILLLNTDTVNTNGLSYAIDRQPGELSLRYMTEAAIDHLYKRYPNGFFVMGEGGAIDHACHGNDPATAIRETDDFNQAIKVAFEFYKKHPKETLILITADHETGGLSLGTRASGYASYLQYIPAQKMSKERFEAQVKSWKKSGEKIEWETVKAFISDRFGLWNEIEMTPADEDKLYAEFQRSFVTRDGESEKTLYVEYDSLSSALFRLLSDKLGIGWTTGAHSGNPVPFFAIGAECERFNRPMDNTDVPRTLRRIYKIGDKK